MKNIKIYRVSYIGFKHSIFYHYFGGNSLFRDSKVTDEDDVVNSLWIYEKN